MAQQYMYERGHIVTLLAIELNSLATATGSVLGTEFDNSVDGAESNFIKADLQLSCSFASAPTAGALVDLYLAPCLDGTTYADGGGAVQPPNLKVGSFIVRNATPQVMVLRGLDLPPTKFKAFLVNNSGQALGASGNALTMLPYRTKV